MRDWPWPSSKTCLRLTPRSGSIQMVTLGRFLRTVGIFGDQFELVGLDAVDRLLAQVLDVPLIGQILAAGAEAEHDVALELAGLLEGGDLVDHGLVELEDAVGEGVDLGDRLAVDFADVGGHLEGFALALVIDRAFLHIGVGNGIGLHGVELEIGGGGVEAGGGDVELVQNSLQVVGRECGAGWQQQEREECGKASFRLRCMNILAVLDATAREKERKASAMGPDFPDQISLGVWAVSQRSTKTASLVTGSMAWRRAFLTSRSEAPGE